MVNDYLPTVRRVLQGKKTWSPQQVSLYKALLNKVLPDLSASHSEKTIRDERVDKLTREELEQLAAEGAKVIGSSRLSKATTSPENRGVSDAVPISVLDEDDDDE